MLCLKKKVQQPKASCQYKVYDPTQGGMICLKCIIEVDFWWSDYNKKKNTVKAEKRAKGKGTEEASEEKGILPELTL